MMMVKASYTETLNGARALTISSLFMLFGLTGCADSDSSPDSVQQQSQRDALLTAPSSELEADQLDEISLTSVFTAEKPAHQPELDPSQASAELDQSMLKSLNKLSQMQDRSIEENSVRELEQLSEADRQALQAITAQQTMTAAEQLAAKQVDKSTERISIK